LSLRSKQLFGQTFPPSALNLFVIASEAKQSVEYFALAITKRISAQVGLQSGYNFKSRDKNLIIDEKLISP
jgi:hypothetical protein